MSNTDAVMIVVDPIFTPGHGLECFKVSVSRTSGKATGHGSVKYRSKSNVEEHRMMCDYIRGFRVPEIELLGVLVVSGFGLSESHCHHGILKVFPDLVVVRGMKKAKHGEDGSDWVLRLVEDHISMDLRLVVVDHRLNPVTVGSKMKEEEEEEKSKIKEMH